MVAPINDPRKKDKPAEESGTLKPDIGNIVDRVLSAEIRLYPATAELVREGIAEVATAAWSETLGNKKLFELSFKIRASVERGKTPSDCSHVAIEIYNDGDYIGSAWAWFESKMLGGRSLSDRQVAFLQRFISESDTYEIAN